MPERHRTRNSEHDAFRMFWRKDRLTRNLPERGAEVFQDTPDVVLAHPDGSGRILGVEITNFFINEGSDVASEQRQRLKREKVVKSAEKSYRNSPKSDRNLMLCVSFDAENPIRDVGSVASCLAQLALSIPQGHEWIQLHRQKTDCLPIEIENVQAISVRPEGHRKPADATWRTLQVHSGHGISIPRLQEILDIKSKKVSGYKNCDAYWLLVVIDSSDRAQDQWLGLTKNPLPSAPPVFERVIVYRTTGEILELGHS
jgi:hypothetical protein